MKKRGIAIFFALLLLPCIAMGETLTDMKAAAPESVTFTIGETVFTAPVVLPEGDTLPTLLCGIYTQTPQEGVSGTCAYAFQEAKKDLIFGNINKYDRVALAQGNLPPENDLTIEDAVAFAVNWYRENGAGDVDFRLDAAVAQSGQCQIHGERVTTSDGVSFLMMRGDLTNPIAGREKGLWEFRLAQYLYGAKLFYTKYWWSPSPVDAQRKQYSYMHPLYNECLMLDEESYNIMLTALRVDEVLREDTQLLPFDQIEAKLNALIQSGDVKSVYRLQLGYMYLLVRDDYAASFDDANTSYVLFPCWEVVSYARNRWNSKKFDSLETPDEQTALFNNFGYFCPSDVDEYRLLLDARTGEVMTPDILYLLPEEVHAQ